MRSIFYLFALVPLSFSALAEPEKPCGITVMSGEYPVKSEICMYPGNNSGGYVRITNLGNEKATICMRTWSNAQRWDTFCAPPLDAGKVTTMSCHSCSLPETTPLILDVTNYTPVAKENR